MSLLGDTFRTIGAVRSIIDAAGRDVARVGLGPIWGAVTQPTGVPLAEGKDGLPRTIHYEDIYTSHQPTIFALINTLTKQTARLPLIAYQGDPYGEHEALPLRHELARLLRKPAPGSTGHDLKQALMLPTLIHGNSAVGKFHGNGPDEPPTELLRLDWRHMGAYARNGGPIEFWTSTQLDGTQRRLEADAVIHTCWQPPSGPLGVSPLQALGVVVASEDAARRFELASLRNGVRPSGVLSLPPDVQTTEEERAEMRADIEAMHRGVDEAFRMGLLTGGATWTPMSFNAADAQLLEQRIVNREECCFVYDVPPPLIGDLGKGSYNNVEELNRQRYKSVLPPWLVLIEETLQAQLIDPEPAWQDDDLFVRFDLSQVLKGDPAEEATAQAELVREGIVTADEARWRFGLQTKGGNAAELRIPINNSAMLSAAPTGDTPAELPAPPDPDLPVLPPPAV